MDASQLNRHQLTQLEKAQRDDLRSEMSSMASHDEVSESQPVKNMQMARTSEGLKSTWEDLS